MQDFSDQAKFLRLSAILLPWAVRLMIVLLAVGLWFALYASPTDYQQGEAVRIMYVHVPAAWMALFIYVNMGIAATLSLIWNHLLAELFCKAIAPIGAGFTAICLITGSLWGEPMWGTWWVWDARLTSVLILFFLYLGYIALVNAFDNQHRGLKAGAVLCLVGMINVPIIKFSVDWWNTLHQPASVSRIGVPRVDPSMLVPLLVMTFAFGTYYVTFALIRMRIEIFERRVQVLRLLRASD